jgi:hypothetical protein
MLPVEIAMQLCFSLLSLLGEFVFWSYKKDAAILSVPMMGLEK